MSQVAQIPTGQFSAVQATAVQSSTVMKRAQRAQQRQLEILSAAATMVAARGFHGMSMRDLAKATGRNLSSLYNDFANKEALLLAIQLRAFESLNHAVEAACGAVLDPNGKLYAFIYQHVRYVVDHSAVMRVLVSEAGALGPDQRTQVRVLKVRYYRQLLPIVAALADSAATPLVIERSTYHLFGMLNWLYGWYEVERHGSMVELADSIYAMAICGISGGCVPPVLPFAARAEMDAPPELL